MKRIITVVICALAFGLVGGCAKQKNPERTAERDYNIATADQRPACPTGGKFGNECPSSYK